MTERGGFTLAEMLVGLAIIAILAAVLYPSVAGQIRAGQSTAYANQMDNLRQAIANYRQNVQRYPGALSELTTAPTAADVDACGTVLGANSAFWRGPYINQAISGNLPLGEAIVLNVLTRIPAAGVNAPGLLQITVAGVNQTNATDLEAQFDGNANFASGTIQWTAAGIDTLKFLIPIRGC